jgi:hypothetical protein
VLITGDLAQFHENYDASGVPSFNTDRAQTLASLDRFKQVAANLHATVIIQHDARDIGGGSQSMIPLCGSRTSPTGPASSRRGSTASGSLP